jgi:glycosyltransferase involved in cell wall biosynthesis
MDFHIIGASIDEFKNAINRKPASNIYCHGRVPHSEIGRYLNTCDILLAPFQKKVEIYGGGGNTVDFMSPLKIFEYMSSGKAIIVSDLPVLHEVLNSETAMFAEADDIQAWVKTIQALEDPKIRKQIGQNAKTRFSKSYTWEKRALRVLGQN